jgi:hypothetical protein
MRTHLFVVVLLAGASAHRELTGLATAPWREEPRLPAIESPQRRGGSARLARRVGLDTAVSVLDSGIPTLQRDEIIAETMRIVGLIGNGRASIFPPCDSFLTFRAFPLSLAISSDGLHVRSARSSLASLAGERVVRIGSESAEEAYRRARTLVGRDNTQGDRFWVPHLLAMPEVLYGLGLTDSPDTARFELESNGRRQIVWLSLQGRGELMALARTGAGDGERGGRRGPR